MARSLSPEALSWHPGLLAGRISGPASVEAAGSERLPQAFERFVRWTIEEERERLAPRLSPADREAFAAYYRGLPAANDAAGIRRYLRGLWAGEAGWVCRWLMWRVGAGQGAPEGAPRVLDAGSGFGTFAMLFASFGARVVAADLREDRVRVARARLELFHEHSSRRLAVRTERVNLTESLGGPYDLVWAYNAISHIHPAERFFASAREGLDPGGVLVIGDINGAQPGHRRRLDALRADVNRTYVSPEGVAHGYAVERPFSPQELRRLAAASGFGVLHHELYYFGRGRLPGPLVRLVVEPLQRCWWLGQPIARRQLMVAAPRVAADRHH